MTLDEIDRIILDAAQANGRISNADLARKVNLSPAATHSRLRRLEREGFIRGYTARLDREKIGYDLLCFIQVSLMVHQFDQVQQFRETVLGMPEVLACYHITGEFDYLLKVVLRNRADLEQFIVNRLTPLPGVARLHTSLVLSEVKTAEKLPVGMSN